MNERTFSVEEAHRLEDPERRVWLPPAEVINALELRPGMAVADIGAGTGYFSLPMARAVGEKGRVYAVDFQTGMLDLLGRKLLDAGAPANITLLHGPASHTTLPDACADLVFMANTWHELDDHAAVLAEVRRVLRRPGILAVVDWRTDREPPPGPPPAHRVSEKHVASALGPEGFRVLRSGHVGKYGYLVMAERAAPPSPKRR
ncbi:MAG: methyltransferase domain-containing protein [Bacteroidota bacterium]